MREKEIYFNNEENNQIFYLVNVLYEYESEPILFLCEDNYNTYYLCNCYEMRNELKWLLCEINKEDLIDLLERKITLRDCFGKSSRKLIHVVYNESDGEVYSSWELNENNEYILPSEGVYLSCNTGENNILLEDLKRETFEYKDTILNCPYETIAKQTWERMLNYLAITNPLSVSTRECAPKYYMHYDVHEITSKTLPSYKSISKNYKIRENKQCYIRTKNVPNENITDEDLVKIA